MNDVIAIFTGPYISLIWTVNPPPLFPAVTPAISIRVLWGFSFHGRGKVWAGEKQLRRLSTCCSSHCKALLCLSKQNNRLYTDFPQNQSESQKKSSILSASADRSQVKHQQMSVLCHTAVNKVCPELPHVNSHVRLSNVNRGKALSSWVLLLISTEQNNHTN